MLNIRAYNNKELLLFPASIGDFLPKDDLTHIVDESVESINLTPYYRKISPVGNPALQQYAYICSISSPLRKNLIIRGTRQIQGNSININK